MFQKTERFLAIEEEKSLNQTVREDMRKLLYIRTDGQVDIKFIGLWRRRLLKILWGSVL